MATSAWSAAERSILKKYAAIQVRAEEADRQALEAAAARLAGEQKKAEDREAANRKSAHIYLEGCDRFEAGLKEACAGLELMKGETKGLLRPLGSSVAYSWRGVLDRVGRYLGQRLADSCDAGDWAGPCKLNATRRWRVGDSFALAERRMLRDLLHPDAPKANGETNGDARHD